MLSGWGGGGLPPVTTATAAVGVFGALRQPPRYVIGIESAQQRGGAAGGRAPMASAAAVLRKLHSGSGAPSAQPPLPRTALPRQSIGTRVRGLPAL